MNAAALPSVRPDLAVLRGPAEWDGAPTWTIHDPVRNRFFRIGWVERTMLRHWGRGDPASIAAATAAELGLEVSTAAVAGFAAFLQSNELVHLDGTGTPPPARHGALTSMLHGYLFFRIPLGSPDRLVAALAPRLAAILSSPAFIIAFAALTLWGLIQTGRQWDVFVSTLPPLASPGGLALYGTMLILSAVAHEFGHAFAARHFGCRVGTMGIAVMVMVPTLYTDTSEVWALTAPRQRLAVAAAGIGAEIILAVAALALWSHLPEGAARSAAVSLATTALAATLLINLSPFMRFDGYFMLSDLLGIANLQERSFALFRWRLRRLVLGLDGPPPETLPPRLQTAVLVWAAVTIVYRAVLYAGIALLVYHSLFKLAGLVLFVVEIGWFLVLPGWREIRAWWSLRAVWNRRRVAAALAIGLAGLAALMVPWQRSVELPATLEAGRHTVLFPPLAGRVATSRIVVGGTVSEGEILLELEAPALRLQLEDVDIRLAAAQWQVDHLMARNADWERIRVEEEALAALRREQGEVLAQLARLEVRAPFSGIIVDRDPALSSGRWVGRADRLADLADLAQCRVIGYADEGDIGRLAAGGRGWFYPDGLDLAPAEVVLTRLDATSARRLDDAYFAGDHGGAIAVRRLPNGPVPARAVFGARFDVQGEAHCPMRRRGTVIIDAAAQSLASRLFRQATRVFNQESGF
jgi:putative peptide zinc metalloprotease protein